MGHPGITGILTGSSILTSISLSGLPAWMAVITAAGALFGLAALRSTAFLWRGERDAAKAKAERLESELADEVSHHRTTLHKLEVSEKKPDVVKLYDLMTAHDQRMAVTSGEIAKTLADVAASLQANTAALTLWATEQAQKFE